MRKSSLVSDKRRLRSLRLFFHRRRIISQSAKPFQSCHDGSQILLASSGRSGGRGELLRNACQRQRDSEAPPFLQYELKVLQEQINFHLRVEAMAHHERAADIDHLRGGGAFFE